MSAPTIWSRFARWVVRCLEAFAESLALSVWDEHGLNHVAPAPAKESATASAYSWRGVLTLQDLERALGELTPDWLKLVRNADKVRFQTSSYLERGQAWTLPEPDPSRPWFDDPNTSRMLVVCHPDDRDAVQAIVDDVRGELL